MTPPPKHTHRRLPGSPARIRATQIWPTSVLVRGLAFVFLAVLTWAGAVASTVVSDGPSHLTWLWVMVVWVLVCLGATPAQTVQRLQQLWAVSVGRRLPPALLQQALREHRWILAGTTGLAGLALAGMSAAVALPLGVGSRPTLALGLVAGVALFLAWQLVLAGTLHGMLRPALGGCLSLLLGSACLVGVVGGQWLRAPPALHLAALFSLPLAGGWVHHGLSRQRPARNNGLATTTWQRWALWRAQCRQRFQKVDIGAHHGALVGLMGQLPNNLAHHSPDARFLQPWGSTLTWAHGLRLVLITACALLLLRVVSPHWRHVLAPGGQHVRRQLGWRIFTATLLAWAGWLLVALLIGALLLWLKSSHAATGTDPSPLVPLALPLLSDLLLGTAAAVWLRAAAGTLARALFSLAGVTLATGLLAGLAMAAGALPWPLPPLGHRGPTWLALQAAVTGVCLLLAQTAWSRVHLDSQLIRRP